MPVKRQPVKVLRFWYRLSKLPEVQALTHPARWWLYGVTMEWTGYNNAAIEFTRRRHAAQYGLDHREVFERARRDVLATGLVMRTRIGGRNLPDLYALTNVPVQVAVDRQNLGTSHAPTPLEILGAPDAPMDEKTGAPHAPNRDVSRPKKNGLHIMNARASEYRKEKTNSQTATPTTPAVATSATEDAGRVETAVEAHAKLRAVH
jgi:hypothetical protein